jgi:hypothetical protein
VAIVEPGSFPTPATSKAIWAERADIAAEYAEDAAGRPPGRMPIDRTAAELPDPQELANTIQTLVDLPPGQRPLRSVVGQVFTEGVAEYNLNLSTTAIYDRTRDHLAEVLRRPDQAITWTPWPGGR